MPPGRKSRYEEFKRGNLLKLTTDWLIDNFHTFTKEEKLRISLVIAPKGVSDKIEVSGIPETRLMIVRANENKQELSNLSERFSSNTISSD